MKPKKIFGIVLAGGEGKRLMPLTEDRAKPAVPFGGHYRLIDFALSNLINSGLTQIVVLTQYKSHSLDRHVSQTWHVSGGLLNSYIASVPAQQRLGKRWFSGSADAILQSLNLIHDEKPDIVVVVGADHVYRMDFSQMIEAHIASGAQATVAAIRQPIDLADQFGVIDVDAATPDRSAAFLEKPQDAVGLADAPHEVLASMGNYVFDTDALIEAVLRDGERTDSSHDMGGDIIPDFVARGEAGVYDLERNDVPGSTDRDRYYWRDVGTIDSFFDAHQDLISALPVFNLYNQAWPIFSAAAATRRRRSSCATRTGALGTMIDSIVSLGSRHLRRPHRTQRARAVGARRLRRAGRRLDPVRPRAASGRAPSCTAPSSTRTSIVAAGATRRRRPRARPARAASASPSPASPSSARACTFTRDDSPRFLVVLDADSTLIQNEVIELLADAAGSRRMVADGDRARHARASSTSPRACARGSRRSAGLPTERVRRGRRADPADAGRARPHRRAARAAAAGSGSSPADSTSSSTRWPARFGLDHWRANRLEVEDGSLTGASRRPDHRRRRPRPPRCASGRLPTGVALAQTVAVGDGANDLAMMAVAGLCVAFNAKPRVRAEADVVIDVADLSQVLPLLGLRG